MFIITYQMQSYSYESIEEEEKQQYKQELGLRKMLFKYQHENQQLKNQIKALTQRLEAILSQKSKNETSHKQENSSPKDKMQEAHGKYLSQQMTYYFKRIEQINIQIKNYKESIDSAKEIEFTNLTNTLKDRESKLQTLKEKVQKFKIEEEQKQKMAEQEKIITTTANSNEEIELKYTNQLAEMKKKLRELEKIRNINSKMDINRHQAMVTLGVKTRKINSLEVDNSFEQSAPARKGLWGLDLTEENYRRILQDFEQLKKQKGVLLESIKIQNNGLRQKVAKLKNEYIDLSSNSNINSNNNSVNLSLNKLKESAVLTPKPKIKQKITLPDIPVPLGNSAYERKNDKNYVPKKIKLIEWNLNKSKRSLPGFSWNDENSKSPITGINLWMDKYLIGIQFIHTLGETTQHLHSEGGQIKKLVPIQYRLNSNDYLENIILVISKNLGKQEYPSNSILGMEFYSKNGRKDCFGLKVGSQGTQKFDFGIIAPEKPIYSFGSFIINSSTHLSSINSLGVAVI